jgi:hypothetical protein
LMTGITTSNRRSCTATYVNENGDAHGEPRFRLLFDPQTNGGLLAAMDSHSAPKAVAALRSQGLVYASVIGRFGLQTEDVLKIT